LKSFHSSNYLTCIVSKDCCGDSDRNTFACLTENMGGGVEDWLTARDRASQNAGIFADVRPEDITALPAQGFAATHLCDLLRSPVESSNTPLQIDRENTFVDRIKYCSFTVV
jgi:hypothetical protein